MSERTCPSCGSAADPAQRFCEGCGASLPAAADGWWAGNDAGPDGDAGSGAPSWLPGADNQTPRHGGPAGSPDWTWEPTTADRDEPGPAPDPNAGATPPPTPAGGGTAPDRREAPRRRGAKLGAVALVVAGLLGLGVTAGAVITNRIDPRPAPIVIDTASAPSADPGAPPGTDLEAELPVEMPDVLGLRLEAAQAALADAGIDNSFVRSIEREYVGDPGIVIGQTPPRRASNPTEVVLLVSKPVTAVPDVTGKKADEAIDVLEATGYRVTREDRYQAGVAEGDVLEVRLDTETEVTVVSASPAQELYLDQVQATESDCSTSSSSSSSSSGSATVNGKHYDHAISCSVRFSEDQPSADDVPQQTYVLGRQVDYVVTEVGLADTAPAGTRVRFEILVDGQVAAAEEVGFGETKGLKADVPGALRITLRVIPLSGVPSRSSSSVSAVWGSPTLGGSPSSIDNLAGLGQP